MNRVQWLYLWVNLNLFDWNYWVDDWGIDSMYQVMQDVKKKGQFLKYFFLFLIKSVFYYYLTQMT